MISRHTSISPLILKNFQLQKTEGTQQYVHYDFTSPSPLDISLK